MSWELFKIKGEWVYMDMKDLYGAISRGDSTDLYTTIFPEGITVDATLAEVMDKHTGAFYEDVSDKDDEGESSGSDPDRDTDSDISVSFEFDSDTGIDGTFVLDSDICLD
jgi:hypothetical protein